MRCGLSFAVNVSNVNFYLVSESKVQILRQASVGFCGKLDFKFAVFIGFYLAVCDGFFFQIVTEIPPAVKLRNPYNLVFYFCVLNFYARIGERVAFYADFLIQSDLFFIVFCKNFKSRAFVFFHAEIMRTRKFCRAERVIA